VGREHDSDFERFFVLAVTYDTLFRNYAITTIQPNFLIHWQYSSIYEAIIRLNSRDKPINFTSVIEEVKRDMGISEDKLEEILDVLRPFVDLDKQKEDQLKSMVDRVLGGVEEEVGTNVMLQVLSEANSLLADKKFKDIFELMAHAQQLSLYKKTHSLSFFDSLNEEEDDMEWERGIPLGIHGEDSNGNMVWLDQDLFYKGLSRGSLFIFAGEGKAGKTSLLQNIAIFQALSGYNVDYYSLEVKIHYLKMRSLSILTDINTNDFLDKEKFEKAKKDVEVILTKNPKYGSIRYFHEKAHTLTPSVISKNIANSVNMGHKVDVVIIDYLDLMGCERRFREPYMEASHNAIAIRDMGTEYNAGIITASQLKVDSKKQFGDRSDVRGGFDRIFTCDLFATITADKEVQENFMGTGKTLRNVTMYMDAVRSGDGEKKLLMKANKKSGRFFNPLPK
jgi:replicative DNA helicase